MGQQSAWLTNYLAQLEANQSVRQPTTQEIAADIIRKSNRYRYNLQPAKNRGYGAAGAAVGKAGGSKGPSTIQRIMDVLSRPLYGTANLVKEGIKEAKQGDIKGALTHTPNLVGAVLHPDEVFEGLSGKKKTTSRDIFKAAGLGEGYGVGGFVRNLTGDILLDPLTYIPGGAIAAGLRGGAKGAQVAREVSTATERVERALNSPAEILRRTSSSRNVPNIRRIEGKTSTTDTVARRVKTTAGLPRSLPSGRARPINLGGGKLKAQEILADVVPSPTRKIDIKKLGIPPRAVAKELPKQFKLDVKKISAIEIARAVAPKSGKTVKDYQIGEKLIKEGDSPNVPVYGLSGEQTGHLRAKQLHEYFRTGKASVPKESEIPDMTGWSDKKAQEFWDKYLVPDKDSLSNLYVKNVDENGNETLVSLAEVRKRVALVKRSKKLKDELPAETPQISAPADTTAWRNSAKAAGLTRSEIDKVLKAENDDDALRLLQEFADKPIKLPKQIKSSTALPEIEDFEIAPAEDIVDAAGEGSQTAAKAMEEAAEATKPRKRVLLDERGGRAVAKVAAHYSELVKKATFRNAQFNPAKQANAFRMLEQELVNEGLLAGFNKVPKDKLLTTSVGKIAAARRSLAMKHLESLEDAMIAAGHPPMSFGKNAYPVRMSDLINAAGGIQTVLAFKGLHLTDLFGTANKFEKFLADNPEAAQLVEKSRAAHAAYEADLIQKGKTAAISATQKAETDPSRTAAEVAEAIKEAPNVARDVIKAASDIPSPEAARMAAQNVKEIINRARPPIPRITQAYAKHFDATVMTGKVTKDTVKGSVSQTKAALDIEGVNPATVAEEISIATDSEATKGLYASFMKAIKPDFRQEDLRPILVENRSLFQTNTSRWAHALNETFKKYPKNVRLNAWKSLQRGRDAGTGIEQQAALEFQKAMESMFGASGFKDAVSSDIRREAITITDINKALKSKNSKFFFSHEVKNELGQNIKLSDWTDAWKYHDLGDQDPVEFIKQMRDAVDRTLLDKTMFDQIATIFGKPGKTQFRHPRLEGIEFSPDIKPQVRRFLEVLDEIAKPNGKFANNYDTALRAWKSGVTIYSPSHHIRNLIGDTFIAWLAGVNNPRVYWKAASVLKSNRHLYSDMEKIDNLVGPGKVAQSLSRQAKTKIVRVAGKDLDAEQIYTIMYNRGLLPHSRVIEDIPTGGREELRLPQPLGGKGKKVARGVSESREHFSRIAHFIDVLGKSKSKDLDAAIENATRVVRKWHPDGLDLTDIEHRWIRRIFPFYSWTRKAIPLMVEGAVKRPSKIIAPNKVLYNLQISMGIDPESLSEPFPVDKEFPDWIRDMAYGPTLGAGSYIVGSNLNPFTSVGEQLVNDPRRGVAGMLTPAIRVPGEILSKSDWQTGQPMETMDKTEYIDKQIPLVAIANRITQGNLGAGSVEALATGNPDAILNHKINEGTGSPTARRDAFLNYLLAAGIIDTQSPANLKSAEFDRRDRVAAQRRKQRQG